MHSIAEADLRAIVRLLGEAAAIQGDFMEMKRHVLDGICDLAGASEWCWAVFDRPPDQPGARMILGLRRSMESAAAPRRLLAELADSGLAASHRESKHPVFLDRHVGPDGHSVIAIVRPPGSRRYSARERRLCRLILGEVPWLHAVENPACGPGRRLSPRLHHVQDLLLLGLSRKEVAHRLGVSLGTVNGYARDLYAFHGVKSHAALMRVCQGSSRAAE